MSFAQQPDGYLLRGTLWVGGEAEEISDGVVVVDRDGIVAYAGPAELSPEGGAPEHTVGWIGPAIIDAHVHMGFGSFDEQRRRGVVAVRDLGAPATLLERWRTERVESGPDVELAWVGQLLTAPGGYPSTSWGKDGYARFVAGPADAVAAVNACVAEGAHLIKLALEPSGGAPVPDLETCRVIVAAAHGVGLTVTSHALGVEMLERALDAGVDELCHTPVETLTDVLVQRIADSDVAICSTIQCFHSGAPAMGEQASANAKRLVAAGVRFTYGTDLGNAGTREGIDSRELQRLADAGLGVRGALLAATQGAAHASGFGGRAGDGTIRVGHKARIIGLASSPLTSADPWAAWDRLDLVAIGMWLQSAAS